MLRNTTLLFAVSVLVLADRLRRPERFGQIDTPVDWRGFSIKVQDLARDDRAPTMPR